MTIELAFSCLVELMALLAVVLVIHEMCQFIWMHYWVDRHIKKLKQMIAELKKEAGKS